MSKYILGDALVLPADADKGVIQVGTGAAQSYPWDDIFGLFFQDPSGANAPTFAEIQTNHVGYAYVANDRFGLKTHFTHRYKKGTDVHAHVHWVHNGTSISGNLVLDWYLTYAKGHGQVAGSLFPAVVHHTQTIATPDLATRPAISHFIDEWQCSAAAPAANQIDTDNLEPDGVISSLVVVTTLPTLGGGGKLFIDFADIHGQHTMGGTANKIPDFYVAP